jgi:integrase
MPRLKNTVLTERLIARTPAPTEGETTLRDASVRGLCIRLRPNGAKAWQFEYRSPITGKTAKITVPARSLTEARQIATGYRTLVQDGRCPRSENKAALLTAQAEHAGAITVADALEKYEKAVVVGHPRQASRRARMAVLRQLCEPWLEATIAKLTRAAIVSRLDEIAAGSGKVQSNRSQSYMRHLLGWCHDRGHVPSVVIDRLKKQHEETGRTRVLSDAEIIDLLDAIATGGSGTIAFGDIALIALCTGMRKGEIANLQPRDLDFEKKTITVRPEISKSKKGRTLPMPAMIEPLLASRCNGLAHLDYIFGEGGGWRRPFSGWGKPMARLLDAMGCEQWSLHDLRRTVATRLHDAKTDALVIEDLLGHISGLRQGVSGVYNRSLTLERQREALADWGARLMEFKAKADALRPADAAVLASGAGAPAAARAADKRIVDLAAARARHTRLVGV